MLYFVIFVWWLVNIILLSKYVVYFILSYFEFVSSAKGHLFTYKNPFTTLYWLWPLYCANIHLTCEQVLHVVHCLNLIILCQLFFGRIVQFLQYNYVNEYFKSPCYISQPRTLVNINERAYLMSSLSLYTHSSRTVLHYFIPYFFCLAHFRKWCCPRTKDHWALASSAALITRAFHSAPTSPASLSRM